MATSKHLKSSTRGQTGPSTVTKTISVPKFHGSQSNAQSDSSNEDDKEIIATRKRPILDLTVETEQLNALISVARRIESPEDVVLVRQTSKERLYEKARLLAQFRQQPFFLKTFEIFCSSLMVDIVCEFVEFSLLYLVEHARLPTQKEVVAITGQARARLPGSSQSEVWKIKPGKCLGEPEICQRNSHKGIPAANVDVQDLGNIIMTLVTKSNESERKPDPGRYTLQLVDFLKQTLTESASHLTQHGLLSSGWRRKHLLSLVSATDPPH
ncbi:uncharacterized protein PV06_11310 [Exophiala oligosperma]|uniref:Uncharacterized protein n=1 Tax=Exophiala oligosperma TaxID=215243 RepID=A0A0D2D2J9_9EURO|nr:uncharacterized protein PV06_11310 [Exophiala oligosperma]KIW36455.1 hypothetical protein PV06_11310 [Exophiala oligosperma]